MALCELKNNDASDMLRRPVRPVIAILVRASARAPESDAGDKL
jgi:hypothetical protein